MMGELEVIVVPKSACRKFLQGCPFTNFGVLLGHWRAGRRLSQLDLALDSDISTRHLSCIETGRAQPSREWSSVSPRPFRSPLRERNALLLAAGYAPPYRHSNLDTHDVDTPEAEAARRAVELLMAQLEPYPVLILDGHWNTLRMNAGAKRFLALFPGCDSETLHNGVRLAIPASRAAALHRKLRCGRRTHYPAAKSGRCRQSIRREVEAFP